jgi:hypothetical protein
VFYGLTVLLDSGFIVFVVYEATAMAGVLVIYSYLTLTHQLKGAVFMVVAVIVNLAGAGVQASNVSLFVFVPFDHNGLFHLIQMVALAVLAVGLSIGMPSQTVEAAALVRSSCTLAQK